MNEADLRETLLRQIAEDPDDTARRLVLADHLMEHGENAWGEFIAAQCELANVRGDAGDETYRVFPDPFEAPRAPDDANRAATLEQRVRALVAAEQGRWKKRFEDRVHHMWFRRGLPEKISIRLATLMDVPDALTTIQQRAPVLTLRFLRWNTPLSPTVLQRTSRVPGLDRIRGLELVHFLEFRREDEQVVHLFEPSSALLHLRYLAILDRLKPESLQLLGAFPFDRLERLHLSTPMQDEGLRALLEGSGMKQLRWLHLSSLELGDEGARTLRDATHLSELDTLSVRGLGDRGLEVLVSAPHLRRLRALRVTQSTIGPQGVAILAQTPMDRLTHLQLSGGPLGDEGVKALAASKMLPQLSSLDLSASGITDRGAKALVESESLRRLEHLDLKENPEMTRDHVRQLRNHFGVGVCTFSRERQPRAARR